MNAEWPIRSHAAPRTPAPSRALPRLDVANRRLRDAALDLDLPNNHRLTDRVRAAAGAIREDLVTGVERALRQELATEFADEALAASLASHSVTIAWPRLCDAGALAYPPLVEIILRRVDGFVLAERLAPAAGGAGLPLGSADEDVAAAATALLVAEARRLDRFGEPTLLFDDLPAELAAWLVWHVAAALGGYLHDVGQLDRAGADTAAVGAAGAMLARHDEGRSLEAAAARLAAAMIAGGELDGAAVAAMISAGQVVAGTASLALAAGVSSASCWAIIADPVDGRLALLLRAAGLDRREAASVLLDLVPPPGDAAAEIAAFDACDDADARDALSAFTLPFGYREALRTLDAQAR